MVRYGVVDRSAMATATAILCAALLLGATGAPALQASYYLDHGSWPGAWDVQEYWLKALPSLIGSTLGYNTFALAWDIAMGIVGTFQSFTAGEILSGSTQVITTWKDIIIDAAAKYGAPLPPVWSIIWAVTKFVIWV